MEFPQQIKDRTALCSSNPTSGYVAKGNEISISNRGLPLPCSFQHFSPWPGCGNNPDVGQKMSGSRTQMCIHVYVCVCIYMDYA